MKRMSRRLRESAHLIDSQKYYDLPEGIEALRQVPSAKFDESLEVSIKLGVNPKHADQMVRGSLVLPHGLGKDKKILVFAKGDQAKSAETAGADFVGDIDLVQKVQGGWLDFDAVVATPEMMREIGKLGKILGTRGLMPSPKNGTVTNDVAHAVQQLKAGKVDFRVDKSGDIHTAVGKMSFATEKLVENASSLIEAILKAKPAAAKGKYLKQVNIASTMSHGVKIDTAQFA